MAANETAGAVLEKTDQRIDRLLFVSFLGQLSELLTRSCSAVTNEQRVELAALAMALKANIHQAQQQINHLPSGDLSLDDQEELIGLLEKQLELELS